MQTITICSFALRQAPSKTTRFSPYELVFGLHVHTPLDLLYLGWKEEVTDRLAVSTYVTELCDRLDSLKDMTMKNALQVSKKRKEANDKGKLERELVVGDAVLCKIPGLSNRLQDSWDSPFRVVKKLLHVNYAAEDIRGRGRK